MLQKYSPKAVYSRVFRTPVFPDPPEAVTRIDPDEVAPAAAGLSRAGVAEIWS